MNKSELVAAVAAKAGMSKAGAAVAVDAMMETIIESVKKGEAVQLIGFGTFSVAERAARKGINPATKQAINIPARKAVRFKAGAKMAL
jgi:DNA-binding protein HU-beta